MKKDDVNNEEKESITQPPEDAREEVAKEPTLEEKCDEYLGGWKRALADYENLKKNLANEKEQDRNRIKIGLAHQLLPVADNFEQAVHHTPAVTLAEEDQKKFDNWMMGVTFIKKQFEEVFASLGIEPIETAGKLDPLQHEAVSEEQDESKEPGSIIKVMQSGWKMGDLVIRPAKVVVSKA